MTFLFAYSTSLKSHVDVELSQELTCSKRKINSEQKSS